MEFAPRTRARNASNFDSVAPKPAEAETFYSHHVIARPLALKGKDYSEAYPGTSEGTGFAGGQVWTLGGPRFPKKLRTGREPDVANSRGYATGLESLGGGATNAGKPNEPASLPSKRQLGQSRDSRGSPQTATSVVGPGDPPGAPPAGQGYAVPALQQQWGQETKRSAFREVAKRHCTASGQGAPHTCANAAQPRPRDGRNDFKFPATEMAVRAPFVTAPPFYGTTHQHPVAFHSGMTHQHCTSVEQETGPPSPASFLPTRNRLEFQNHIPGCELLKSVDSNAGVRKEAAVAMQFSPFQNGARPAEQFSPLPFPWQQPLVSTSVLPLSPSVPGGRQYDNWCAKCNASFRMTSDLVYHMRTQHKRSSADGSASRGRAAPASSAPSASGASAGGAPRGKRAEEKLKCERCGETFRERHHLTRHMTSHNSDPE